MSWLDKFISSAPTGPAGGSLGANYPTPTVVQVDGAGGVLPVTATSGTIGSGSSFPMPFAFVSGQTVGTTPLVLDTNPILDMTSTYFEYLVLGRDAANGDTWRGKFTGTYTRAGGAPVAVAGFDAADAPGTSGGASGWTVVVSVSGNNALTTVTGATGRTVHWTLRRTQPQRG